MSAANTPPPRNYSQPSTVNSAPYSPMNTDSFAGDWPGYGNPRTSHRPTAEQLARDEQRRRFLRRNVYAPIIIAAVIVIALFVLIVLLAFGVVPPPAASFIAGLSGLTIILISIPLIFLMSILPIIWLALTLNRRQRRKDYPETGPMAYRSRVQILFWQLDSLLDGVQRGVDGVSARARKPLVDMHGRAAYVQEFWQGLRERFTRSN